MFTFELTDSAANRIKQLLAENKDGAEALRVAVDGGGCNGFMYEFKLESNQQDLDKDLSIKGVKVLIDEVSAEFLDGCELDFITELGASYFQVNNPKASAKCGCGNSFSV